MMGYNYAYSQSGLGTFGFITWFVILVDLVLVGIWLWQNISKR
jgi:hypothetical protein